MKTIADLNALSDKLLDLMLDDPQIGDTYWDQDEDGWGKCSDWESNNICYEEDGWCIEIFYECNGKYCNDPGDYYTPPCYDLISATGRVSEIVASHYDEETEEETEFSEEDTKELESLLNAGMEYIS